MANRLQPLLPQGQDLEKTCRSFEELRDCVAALHAAANVNIDFSQLTAKLTGEHWVRLKTAIHQLRSDVDPRAEAKKANAQAKQDMRESKKK